MAGRILFFVLVWAVVGCAKPTYVSTHDNGTLGEQNISTDCGLEFKNSKLCLTWKWETKPTATTAGSFWFRIYKLDEKDGFPILITPENTPFVQLWMPSMGHGSAPVTIRELSAGTYQAQNVFFIMAGEWEIHFQLKNGPDILDESIVSLTF